MDLRITYSYNLTKTLYTNKKKKSPVFDKILKSRIQPPLVSQSSNVSRITSRNPTRVKKPDFEERLSHNENNVNFSNINRTLMQS